MVRAPLHRLSCGARKSVRAVPGVHVQRIHQFTAVLRKHYRSAQAAATRDN